MNITVTTAIRKSGRGYYRRRPALFVAAALAALAILPTAVFADDDFGGFFSYDSGGFSGYDFGGYSGYDGYDLGGYSDYDIGGYSSYDIGGFSSGDMGGFVATGQEIGAPAAEAPAGFEFGGVAPADSGFAFSGGDVFGAAVTGEEFSSGGGAASPQPAPEPLSSTAPEPAPAPAPETPPALPTPPELPGPELPEPLPEPALALSVERAGVEGPEVAGIAFAQIFAAEPSIEPAAAAINLSQAPYTGIGSTVAMLAFLAGVFIASGAAAYLLVLRERTAPRGRETAALRPVFAAW